MSNSNNGGQGRPPGSNVALPSTLTLSSFTTARLKEIQMMRKYMSESTSTKMAFQKLPKHMRRRAMSHVVKRLPRRLREIHANQMKKSGLPPRSKRPTRKYRRRPLNLQQDYIRRQRRVKWLNTHIWHAKRFHMIEKWGYKLPKQPCDKSFRACYRATTQHCLLQDLSYMRCIEISGLYEDIVSELQRITNPKAGLTFKAKCFSEGKKFGELMIFEPSSEPKKAVGEVQFLWSKNMTEKRFLWMFVHPAYYTQILNILLALYDVDISGDSKSEGISAHYAKNGIVIRELEYEVGKLRLTGTLSTAVLTEALRPYLLTEDSEKVPTWLSDWPLDVLMDQNEVFTDLPHVLCLPPNMVLSVLVRDPRLNMPKQRTKAMTSGVFGPSTDDEIALFQKNVSLSPLLDDSVRTFVKEHKASNKSICDLRRKCLVPGSEFSMENESVIPIVLLWRSGNKTLENNGYSAGWDIILPTCWIQSFFLSFIMWGARAGGLRETESIAFEACKSDLLHPDTEAGCMEEDQVTQLCKNKFFRLPPNKRTNYNKFGIVSPFSFNWKMLISEWSGTCDSFSVLRDITLLKSIQESLSSKTTLPLSSIPKNCLIPVKVVPVKKGVCTKFGLICLPLDSDKTEPLEPKRKDVYAQKRKALRDEHKKLLQRLRKRRRRCYKLGKPVTKTDTEVLRSYTEQTRKLWLPEPENIAKSCSRVVIGFVKHGGFSFSLGQSKGLGYITGGCLDALAKLPQRNKVLVRNSNSRQYRLAVLSVILE